MSPDSPDRGGLRPPSLLERLLAWLAPPDHRDAVVGDAREEFARLRASRGVAEARRWYLWQVLGSLRPGLGHKAQEMRQAWRVMSPKGEGVSMWIKEFRLAVRTLSKRPGFSATVVMTLGLGVGATTALFGVFRSVFLEPLPLPDSQELVVVMEAASFGCCGPASGPDYLDWVERQRSFDGMAALAPTTVTLTGLDEPERVYGTYVTPSAFDFLGVNALLGRRFLADDALTPGSVLLSYRLWQRLFAGRPDVVGSTLDIDGEPREIIGVMPEGFDVPSPWAQPLAHQLYLPFLNKNLEGQRGNHGFPVIARLSDGTTVEAAQADMDRMMRELAEEYPATNAERTAQVFTVHEYLFGSAGRVLGMILGAAGLVLLIACGNVAGLQLARVASREGELSLRAALGASRGVIVRLLFSESVTLAALGGIVGVFAAMAGLQALKAVLPTSIPRVEQIQIEHWALFFALGAAAFTALASGMVPALIASRGNLAAGVREGGSAQSPRKERTRDYFIVGQIALGLVLANGAALLVQSYVEVRGQAYGFTSEGVLTMSISPNGPAYQTPADREAYLEQVSQRVGAVPGVDRVGFITRLPLRGGSNGNVLVEGHGPRSSVDQGPLVEVTSVAGDYFAAMGIPLMKGRLLEADDSIPTAVGVVINETMAKTVWAGEDPLGKRFSFSDTPPQWLTVVGVVGDVRQWGPETAPMNHAYYPFRRGWTTSGYLVVRIAGEATAAVAEVRRAILSVDPTQPPSSLRGMDEIMEAAFARRRFYTTLIGLFALAALLLASAGIYGTVSYYVTRRTREMGIRIALGAGDTGILALVLRRGIRLAFWGVAVGLLGVWAATSLLESMVYGIRAADAPTLLVGCLILGGVTLAASTLPALRAIRVPPSTALRVE